VKQLEIPSTVPEPTGAPDEQVEGTLFGRYRLIRRIGKGGMAEAFLAVLEGAKGFRRKCVVKRIRPDKAASTNFTQMFADEARITAALHHPNIVQVYEFGEVGNLFFLTMEYLDGRTLAALLDGLHARGLLMPINMAAHISRQVARGLHYAHNLTDDFGVALGVIHRDVSPTNVMLLRTGEVKILDFGVAKAERALKQGATVVGKVKGKLSYMAPEQHSGKAVDQRADVFALGVMLWEMLTGELLFAGASGGERSRKMMRGQVPAPSTLRPKVSPALDAIVMRCLQLQPEDRFPSAGALADELGAFVRPSLFDPMELAALLADQPAEEESVTAREEREPSPLVMDSHAILTREDARAEQLDDLLMSATTSRERIRPIMKTVPIPSDLPLPAPPPPVAAPPPVSGPRRFWPVPLVMAAAVGLALLAVPRRSPTTTTSSPASRPRTEILQVPIAPAAIEAPPSDFGVPPPIAEPTRPEPSRPAPKAPASPRRRARASEPKPAPPPVTASEPRLVNPF
jgi:eukaryotic-like serine/threonine-protein kinase